jgi:heme-degrading monooxygenase HmoA
MVTYIATLLVKPGHELDVSRYYQELEPLLCEAKGFHGRNVYRARPGTVEAEVRRVTPAAELAAHPHHDDGPQGVQFVIVEKWDSIADRIAFSRGASKSRAAQLFPHLLPAHSHEVYEDVTTAG